MATAAIIGAGVLGAGATMYAADKASDAQESAAARAGDTEWAMYNQSREDLAPWREAGGEAINLLMGERQYALPEPDRAAIEAELTPEVVDSLPDVFRFFNKEGTQRAVDRAVDKEYNRQMEEYLKSGSYSGGLLTGNYDAFKASPGYEFNLSEGVNALDRSAAARGRLSSGGHEKEIMRYGSGLASNEYNNYINQLFSVAGLGQNATNTGVQAGQNAAGAIGSNYLAAGNARASGYINTANALTGSINSGLNNYLAWQGASGVPGGSGQPNYNYGYGTGYSGYGVGGV